MQATTLFTIAILIIAAGLLATWLIKRKKGKSQVGTPPGQETTRSDAARSESPRTDSARVVPRETVESGNRGQVPAREPAATQPAAVKHGGKKGKSKKSGKKGATKAAPAAVESMAADAYVEEETVADTGSAEVLAENVLDDYSTQEAVAEQEWTEEPAYTATLTEELVVVDVQPELPPAVTVLVEETVIEEPVVEEPVVEEPAAVEEPVIEEEPAVEETVFEEPVVEEPVVEEPVVEETVVEETVTAETTTPAAVEFVDAPLEVDGFDDEIADIFMEEAEEVLETIHEYYPKWRDNFSDKKALTEFRRGFHTLKGSGRMAKAFEVGELAWSIENMLNRVMDNSIQPGPEVCLVIDRTLEKVPFMLSAFHQRKVDPQPALTQRIYNAAVALAEGKPMPSID